MNNKTAKKIIVLGSLVFSFLFAATNTFAYSCMSYDCESYDYNTNNNQGYSQYDYSQHVVPIEYVRSDTKPTVINNYYYQNTPNPNTTTINREVNTVRTNEDNYTTDNYQTENNQNNIDDEYYRNNLGASAYGSYDQSRENDITALSLRGSGSFMPSSIWQWILVIILILAIIIIARMFVRKPHPADHDTHVTHAH